MSRKIEDHVRKQKNDYIANKLKNYDGEFDDITELYYFIYHVYTQVIDSAQDVTEFLLSYDISPYELINEWNNDVLPPEMFSYCNQFTDKKLIIPDCVTWITDEVFYKSNIKKIDCANVSKIGPKSFFKSSLSQIYMPNVEYIAHDAFNGSQLTYIELSNKTQRIGNNAFVGCSKIIIPREVVNRIGSTDKTDKENIDDLRHYSGGVNWEIIE